jgi:regulator of protease activity HflC (stomatin/prohibitin superfamily)
MLASIIIGTLLILVAFFFQKTPNPFSKFSIYLIYAGVFIIFIGIFSAMFVQVNPGKVGVKSLFGKVQKGVLPSGLHLINPLMDITIFDVQTHNYTMSAVHDEGDKGGDDAIRVLSNDGLEVVIDLTVLYRIIPEQAPTIYQTIGENYNDKIVRPITRTRIRDNAVFYDAISLYSTKRDEFQREYSKRLRLILKLADWF